MIFKMTLKEKPIVALVAPKEAITIPPDLRRMYEQMGQPIPESQDPYDILEKVLDFEKYEVVRVELTQESPLPDKYDTLVIINPRSFNERQRWEINRALHSGKSVVLAVQNHEWDYRPTSRGFQIDLRKENPDMNPLLENYGLGIDEDILMDANNIPLNVQMNNGPLGGLLRMSQPIDNPMHMLINNATMDTDTSITSRLSAIFYLWGTALNLDDAKLKELGLSAKILITTSKKSWKRSNEALSNDVFVEPEVPEGPYPLMALVQGQFPDAFADQERPAWPASLPSPGQPFTPPTPETDEPVSIEAAPGKLVLIGCSQMFRTSFLQSGNLDHLSNGNPRQLSPRYN
jgi:hypothetical protein